MKTRTIMAAVFAAILIVICGGSAIHYLLDNMPVVFNDPALELAVRTGLGISDRPITRKEAREVVSLDLSLMEGYTKEITDLRGLSAFSNLKKLNLSNNMVTDISELSKLKELKILHLVGNQISDVSALSSLTNLEFLDLEGNKISDISALKRLTRLTVLDLRNNHISDISSLSAMKDMRCLYLGNNEITDITPLQSLVKLTYLSMGGNEISDIEPISDMKTLDHQQPDQRHQRAPGPPQPRISGRPRKSDRFRLYT